MKDKYKILPGKPVVNDHEIGEYMDFDKLVTKHAHILSFYQIVKGIGWTFLGVGITAVVYLAVDNYRATPDLTQETSADQVQNMTNTGSDNEILLVDDTKEDDDEASAERISSIKPQRASTPAPKKVEAKRHEVKRADQPAPSKFIPSQQDYIPTAPINGYKHLYDYFNGAVNYPQAAMADSLEGVVMVSFTISASGEVEKIKADDTLGELFSQEAIRVIENMPDWQPAQLNGVPVSARLSIPLVFQIFEESSQSNQ